MTTSSPIRARNRSPRAGTTSAAGPSSGRADTHVTAHDGRAVCFVSGEPSGLSATLPLALAELKKAAGPGARDHARLRPRRRLPAGLHALPRAEGALGHLPPGTAGRPREAARHHHDHLRRPDPADQLGRGDGAAQGLRRRPADHPVRARPGRLADPDLGPRCVPGGDPVLAEITVAGRELPQVRQRELRDRQDLRLPRHHRDERETDPQPGPRPGQRRRPRRGEDPGRR